MYYLILELKKMKIISSEIKQSTVWILLDQLRTYTHDMKNTECRDEFLCYFKMSEPTPFIYGELLRDSSGTPILFKSADEAIEVCKEHLNKLL